MLIQDYLQLANNCFNDEKYTEALTHIDLAHALAQTELNAAEECASSDDCERLILARCDMAEVKGFYANAKLYLGEYLEALREAKISLEYDARNSGTQLIIARIYSQLRNPKKSIHHYLEYFELMPEQDLHPTFYNELANEYFADENYDAAINGYKNAINRDDQDDVVFSNLANTYAQVGEIDLAIENYTAALDLQPNSILYLDRRAKLYLQTNQADLAANDYLTIAQIDHTEWPSIRRVLDRIYDSQPEDQNTHKRRRKDNDDDSSEASKTSEKTQHDSMLAEMEILRNRITVLTSEKATLENQVNREITDLLLENGKLENEVRMLKAQNTTLSAGQTDLSERLTLANSQSERMRSENEALRLQIASLTAENNASNSRWHEVSNTLGRMESGISRSHSSVITALDNHGRAIEQIHASVKPSKKPGALTQLTHYNPTTFTKRVPAGTPREQSASSTTIGLTLTNTQAPR